jgi:hypothetical protein
VITRIQQNIKIFQINTIHIITNGIIHHSHLSISGLLYINGTQTLEIYGNITRPNEPDNLTLSTSASYFLLQQLQQLTTRNSFNDNVTILFDNKSLVSRIQKMKRKIYPNACLLKDFEIIQSISTSLNHIKNGLIVYNIGTNIHDNNSEPNMEKTVCQQLLPQTETLPIPTKPITTIAHQKFELILDNTQINSNYISTSSCCSQTRSMEIL